MSHVNSPVTGARFRLLLACGGIAAMILALTLFFVRTHKLSTMREEAVRVGNRLPELRAEIRLLEARISADEAYGSDLRASLEEQAAAFVLPESVDAAHAQRVVREIVSALGRTEAGSLTINSLRFTPADDESASLLLTGNGTEQEVAALFGVLQWGGYLTVQDALGAHSDAFLKTVEQLSPLSLPTIEEFLRTDLLTYAVDPDSLEQRLFRDMSPSLAAELRTMLLQSGLGRVRLTLTPVAKTLKERRAWPLPLFELAELSLEDGTVELKLWVRHREEPEA